MLPPPTPEPSVAGTGVLEYFWSMFHKDRADVGEEVLRRVVLQMTQEITEPKIPSENAEYFTAAAAREANQIYAKFKRLCEIFVIIVLAPPILLTTALLALAILWTMGRPVLVKQERVGKGGRIFKQLSFRTRMEGSTSAHPRMTLLGRFLEDSCLAELPRLWNVLVAEMSIVGPCPESPNEASSYRDKVPNYELRQSVRPGITGYAQVYLGSASPSTRIEYDLHYVRQMDAALDLIIIWHSLFPGIERHPLFKGGGRS
jgi:lipopolysaccharide/colanic/teichoic acid biosynthesis glycosyltransferase